MEYKFPNEHLSISSLQSFNNCPFSFHQKYIAGIKPPQKEKAKDGAFFQEALNEKYRGNDPKSAIQKMTPKMRGVATMLLNQAHSFDNIISLDESYKVDLGFGIPIMFIPDVLTNPAIIENKFTTGYYNPKMVLTERQRVVYYVGVRKLFGFDPKVYYQIFNTSKKTVELVETPTGPKDIDELMDWIDLKLRQVNKCYEADIWDIGPTHSWCDYPSICPLEKKYGKPKFSRK